MAKHHYERRDSSGRALCGINMPHDAQAWDDLETCERCSDISNRQTLAGAARALAERSAPVALETLQDLHTAALQAGDEAQAELCARALAGDMAARGECLRVVEAAAADDSEEARDMRRFRVELATLQKAAERLACYVASALVANTRDGMRDELREACCEARTLTGDLDELAERVEAVKAAALTEHAQALAAGRALDRAGEGEATAPTVLHATTRDSEGQEISLTGDSVEALAAELASHGDEALSATVYDARGFVRGWIHGDGHYKAQ